MFTKAIYELNQIDKFKTPGDKIECVVKSASIIFWTLESVSKQSTISNGEEIASASAIGADDFLPVFIYAVLKSLSPKLQSNCEYIQRFLSPLRMMSQAGYYLINLRSAIEFIMTLDSSNLTMDPLEFNKQVRLAERTIPRREVSV